MSYPPGYEGFYAGQGPGWPGAGYPYGFMPGGPQKSKSSAGVILTVLLLLVLVAGGGGAYYWFVYKKGGAGHHQASGHKSHSSSDQGKHKDDHDQGDDKSPSDKDHEPSDTSSTSSPSPTPSPEESRYTANPSFDPCMIPISTFQDAGFSGRLRVDRERTDLLKQREKNSPYNKKYGVRFNDLCWYDTGNLGENNIGQLVRITLYDNQGGSFKEKFPSFEKANIQSSRAGVQSGKLHFQQIRWGGCQGFMISNVERIPAARTTDHQEHYLGRSIVMLENGTYLLVGIMAHTRDSASTLVTYGAHKMLDALEKQ